MMADATNEITIESNPDVDLNERDELVLQTPTGPVTVRAWRSFPWSAPDRFIILRDDESNERAAIDDLEQLPARSRGAIEAWLQRHTLVPKVLHVLDARPANAAWLFEFDTDRGVRKVTLREREDLRFLPDGRCILRDSDGQSWELPALADFDKASRRELAKII